MSFVRARSNSTPAVLRTYFQAPVGNGAGHRNAASNAEGSPFVAPHRGAGSSRPTLMINGSRIDFAPIINNPGRSDEGRSADARVMIETNLRSAGVDPALAPALSRLLCDADFVGADGIAVNRALDGSFTIGEPSMRELNVMVDRDGVSVHRCSTWSECKDGAMPDDPAIKQANLLCVDPGVRFHVERDKAGNALVKCRPDYWVHTTPSQPAVPELAELLESKPAGSTAWDRFVDAIAWLVGAVGIRFENAENLGKEQAALLRHARGGATSHPSNEFALRARRMVAADLGAGAVRRHLPGLPALAASAALGNALEVFRVAQANARKTLNRKLQMSGPGAIAEANLAHAAKLEAQSHGSIHSKLVEMPVQLMQREHKGAEAMHLQEVAQAPVADGAARALANDSVVGLVMAILQDSSFGEGLGEQDDQFGERTREAEERFIKQCRNAAISGDGNLRTLQQRITRAAETAELVARQLQEIGQGPKETYIANAPHALGVVARIARAALASDVFATVKPPKTKPESGMVAQRDAKPSFSASKILSQTDNASLLFLCGLSYSDVDSYFRRE